MILLMIQIMVPTIPKFLLQTMGLVKIDALGLDKEVCSSGKNNIANADLDSCVLPTYSSEMDDAEHEEGIEDDSVHV